MRRGKVLVVLAFIFGLIASTTLTLAQKNPEEITIDHAKKDKPAVKFEHKKHNTDRKIACKDCHHKSEAGKEITDGCGKCHGKAADGDKPEAKKAYHKNCLDDCHKKEKKGPTKCDGCHQK